MNNLHVRRHYYLLDNIRGFAAVAVMVWHYSHFFNNYVGEIDFIDKYNYPLYDYFSWMYEGKFKPVELFWVLSGFVFMATYGEQKVSSRAYVVNRIARLYPLHFLTLILVCILQIFAINIYGQWFIYDNNDPFHFFLNIFMASYWGFEKGNSFNGPIWSVSLEIVLYAVFLMYIKFFGGKKYVATYIFLIFCGVNYFFEDALKRISLCGIFFFGGIIVYKAHIFIEKSYLKILVAMILVVVGLLGIKFGSVFQKQFGWLFVSTGIVLILSLTKLDEIYCIMARKIVGLKIVDEIGKASYGIYLWHVPVQLLLVLLLKESGLLGIYRLEWQFFVSYVVVVCLLAIFSYNYIERPMAFGIKKLLLNESNKPH